MSKAIRDHFRQLEIGGLGPVYTSLIILEFKSPMEDGEPPEKARESWKRALLRIRGEPQWGLTYWGNALDNPKVLVLIVQFMTFKMKRPELEHFLQATLFKNTASSGSIEPLLPLLQFLEHPPQIWNFFMHDALFSLDGRFDEALKQDLKACEIFLIKIPTEENLLDYKALLGYGAPFPLKSITQTRTLTTGGCLQNGEPYLIRDQRGLAKELTTGLSSGHEHVVLFVQWPSWEFAEQVKDPLQASYEDKKGRRARDDIWSITVERELQTVTQKGGGCQMLRTNLHRDTP